MIAAFDRAKVLRLFVDLWIKAPRTLNWDGKVRREVRYNDLTLSNGANVFDELERKSGYPLYYISGRTCAWEEQTVTVHWVVLSLEAYELAVKRFEAKARRAAKAV
jgi:hypothetical protein